MSKSNVILLFPELRSWERLVGVSGDITDIVLGLLATLAEDYGILYLKMEQYYRAFILFWQQHPQMAAGTDVSKWSESAYRHRLSFVLEMASSLGIEYGNRPRDIMVRNPQAVLGRLEERVGPEFIGRLRSMSKDLFDTFCAVAV